jgi:hypothetical protein
MRRVSFALCARRALTATRLSRYTDAATRVKRIPGMAGEYSGWLSRPSPPPTHPPGSFCAPWPFEDSILQCGALDAVDSAAPLRLCCNPTHTCSGGSLCAGTSHFPRDQLASGQHRHNSRGGIWYGSAVDREHARLAQHVRHCSALRFVGPSFHSGLCFRYPPAGGVECAVYTALHSRRMPVCVMCHRA